MILRGDENLEYPSRKEFQHLAEIMHNVRTITSQAQLPCLTSVIGEFVPHALAASGTFNIRKREMQFGFSNYGEEHTHLYATQGFAVDPAIQLLQTTKIGTVTSEDRLDLVIPREITNLKLDAGIKTCLTVGVRGVLGVCTYFAFSNFDQKLQWKLRTLMQIMAPHLHLAYMRATIRSEQDESFSKKPVLTAREEEIMRWVAEGKTNWEISIILKVSLNTVKFHLKNIYQKFGGVENRWTAAAQWQWCSAGLLIPTPPKQHTGKPNPPKRSSS